MGKLRPKSVYVSCGPWQGFSYASDKSITDSQGFVKGYFYIVFLDENIAMAIILSVY